VKFAFSHAHTLINLDYTFYFIIFSFASKHTLAIFLIQKKDRKTKHLIAFFSITIRDGDLKYNIIENQALALVKALKDFQVYVLHSHIFAYVLNDFVKDVLMQNDPEGRHGKWISTMLEYDLDIIPTDLVKG